MAKLHPLQKKLAPVLAPCSLIYGAAASAKRILTRHGLLKSTGLTRPCVSIGNISWGGTGKTPVTDWLLAKAERSGLRAAVLTRGYGSKPPFLPYPVLPDSRACDCGDEPLMLKKNHPSADIIVDYKRLRGALSLTGTPPDFFILDDGFQHIAVKRDLNLVLLDIEDIPASPVPGRNPSNWNRVIPLGSWREPQGAFLDADAFLVKAEPDEWNSLAADLQRRLAHFPRPVFAFRLAARGLIPINRNADSERPAGDYAFVSGIGAPEQAARTAGDYIGRVPAIRLDLPDHHDFSGEKARLESLGIPLVCTAKDAVKLAALDLSVPCWSLTVHAEFHASLSPEQITEPNGSATFPPLSFETWWDEWQQTHIPAHT